MSRQIQNFVNDCLNNYGNCVDKLPTFVKHEFAALLMSQDDAYACEATSPDNPQWNAKMLPALLTFIKNEADSDAVIKFNDTWRDCVTTYMSPTMQSLLEEGYC